jgi:geranylgeranyl pyrophosphate synthase
MPMPDQEQIVDRAKLEAREVLDYFKRLEALGAFVGEDVEEQKKTFLCFSLINFSRREQILHAEKDDA